MKSRALYHVHAGADCLLPIQYPHWREARAVAHAIRLAGRPAWVFIQPTTVTGEVIDKWIYMTEEGTQDGSVFAGALHR